MNEWSRLVALVLGISASLGCHHVSHSRSLVDSPLAVPEPLVAIGERMSAAVAPMSADLATVRGAGVEMEGSPASEARQASAVSVADEGKKTRCSIDVDGERFYGFYSSDAWQKGEVVLTFDDGPHPTGTPRVLDLLASRKLPATFFLVGRAINATTFPLVQRIVAEGHSLGSHSYSHDVKMTRVETPEATVDTIRAEHEVTRILIDVALMAESPEDFDAMYRRVFEENPAAWLTRSAIRGGWRAFVARHRSLLDERGFEGDRHPYDLVYSRPPGGGPYVEQGGAAGMALYDRALEELGMINVMWHGASGDTHPELRSDFAYLSSNLEQYAKNGGVLLVHDYIRGDALAHGLASMSASAEVRVIPIEQAVKTKYRCDARTLYHHLREKPVAASEPTLAAAAPING